MHFFRTCIASAIVICFAWSPVAAQTPVEILQDFGFFGQWAQDCANRAYNSRKVVPLPDGKVEMRSSIGTSENVYIVQEARRTGADEVWIKTLLNNQEEIELEIARSDGRLRTMAGRATNGAYFTKDGTILSSGQPTPWLQRCG